MNLDLFRWIPSQTTDEDKTALLTARDVIAELVKNYCYLEIGSHLGGSLQPHIVDKRCATIFSIDPRPQEQPDERKNGTYKYSGNSTARMLNNLKNIPNANISKLITFEKSSWELSSGDVSKKIDLAFVDGEHTNAAVLQDFHAVRTMLKDASILAFHDCFVTPLAIMQIEKECKPTGKYFYFPNSNIVCFAFGGQQIESLLRQRGWVEDKPDYAVKALKLKKIAKREELRESIKRKCPWISGIWHFIKNH